MRRKGKGMYDYRKDKKEYIAKQRAKKVIYRCSGGIHDNFAAGGTFLRIKEIEYD